MAELMAKKEDVITADLASIPPERLDGPKLVKDQEPKTLARVAAVSEPIPLFTESDGRFPSAVEQGTDRFCERAAPDRQGCRQAGSSGDAATRGRFRQRAIGSGKAMGQWRQRFH
jgi:hypothetical protein